jgi:hypothetical protein
MRSASRAQMRSTLFRSLRLSIEYLKAADAAP